MVNDIHDIDFLRDRIHEIRSALFSNTSNATYKLPTCIISALNIDSEGMICFFIRRPDQYMEEHEKEFPARLDFYRKGKPFFLKISGDAQLVTDQEAMMDSMGLPGMAPLPSLSRLLLVKVKVMESQYLDLRHRSFQWKDWWQQLRQYFRPKGHVQPQPSYNLHPSVLPS
ncbi:MAG: hypothetical protein P0Y53_13500 [Candidatus Pseudobacter hemicellulosilyticus]|uniref:Uncharacterized protein n=1 Tax=Candidatus Pseudobacter hemicellulosilyticus TaxID=3121375 RepID=A0AAJ6BFX3_9BACT|nr:MAG: hypothetical protein P0Y53_13500 [Pseudobacter sp.]